MCWSRACAIHGQTEKQNSRAAVVGDTERDSSRLMVTELQGLAPTAQGKRRPRHW